MANYDLEKILPHNHPMILIDDILNVDLKNETLSTLFIVTKDKLFFDKENQGIQSSAALELMAQTIGCYAYFKNAKKEPQMGFLLGSRLFETSIDYFKPGEIYIITVKAIFYDNNICAFDCIIKRKSDNEEIANATVNVYQNDDIKEQWSE